LQGNWLGPNQFTQALHNGRLHNIAIIADGDANVVNVGGDHSIRGGCLAQKVYNENKLTRDRLKHPLLRIDGVLVPVSWDLALDVAAELSKHVIRQHGESAWALKYQSYQFFENTYALTRLAFRSINTPAVAHHDHPSIVSGASGWVDIGYDPFPASYEDFALADCILISGTDPYETKTIVWNEWILKGIRSNNTRVIMVNPRKTMGAAFAEKHGGLHLDVNPGSDTALHMALQRIILENGWEDTAFIEQWVANQWDTDSGAGQGTRDTPRQWRTTWDRFRVKDFQDWKQWLLSQEESKPEVAARIAGIEPAKIHQAAAMMARPRANGDRIKTTIAIEKGNYWSNNYLNTASIGTLGVILGCGGRPGRAITRLGGHQRGGRNGGRYPDWKSPNKMPGRRRQRLDLDRWVEGGHVRFAYVVGTTWIQAMAGSQALSDTFQRQTRGNPHQVHSEDKQQIIETLKRRVDSGGMLVVNQDIYLTRPIGSQFADIVLPAATWGEANFTRCNGERRIRLYSKFYDPPGEAKPDWEIVSMLAQKMGFDGYDWRGPSEVFEESCAFSRGTRTDYHVLCTLAGLRGITAHEQLRRYGTTGLQCPLFLDGNEILETKRLHDFERKDIPETGPAGLSVQSKELMAFKSHTGKLNLLKSPWGIWADFYAFMQPRGDELWVTNGRINEIWQSGFDDVQRRRYIQQRWPENYLEIHPDDARQRRIESGDRVRIASDRVPVQKGLILGIKSDDMWFSGLMKHNHIQLVSGQFEAVAIITPAIKRGVVFTNYLNKSNPANSITPRVPDPLSMNYRFKISSGVVTRIGESPYKNSFAQMSFKRRTII
jgi:arsenite oxidase large subunit